MARNNEVAPDLAINRVVEGTSIEGEIRCESNIRIDGTFKGNLTTKGRLVVGPAGKLEGTINCQNAELEGVVKGKIHVQQLLSLKGTSRVEGDIFTDKLAIEPGATFTGACNMGAKVKDIKKESTRVGEAAEAAAI
ncbi:MAG: polymer-forming cytoskeletal protein [Flavobacteriales bacterium]|jgi:cytoskeletal protein CcmA (bactofilin family)